MLDNDKHYYIGADEAEKLLRHGAGWLATHPAKDLIAQRYLRHQRSLQRAALSRLIVEELPEVEEATTLQDAEETVTEAQLSAELGDEAPANVRRVSLHDLRLDAVLAVLKTCGAQRVLDLGCGEGRLLALLLKEKGFR